MGGTTKHAIRKTERAPFNVGVGFTRTVYFVQVKLNGAKRWTELANESGQYEFTCAQDRDVFFNHVLKTYPTQYRNAA